MKERTRLYWLLAVVASLLILRWIVPPTSADAESAIAPAIVRAPATNAPTPAVPPASGLTQDGATPTAEVEAVGNPFAVRTPPPPPAPAPVPVVAVQAQPVVQTPPPVPVIAPPPLQVIGTWDDGSGLAAFVAGPNTTLLARPGVLLLGEYSVTAVTKQQVTLVHVPSKRDVRLPVPRAPGA